MLFFRNVLLASALLFVLAGAPRSTLRPCRLEHAAAAAIAALPRPILNARCTPAACILKIGFRSAANRPTFTRGFIVRLSLTPSGTTEFKLVTTGWSIALPRRTA